MRSPLARLPRPWRIAADWVITIGLAVAVVLAFEAEVAKPYRVPSSSMEPTLHCARPGYECRAGTSDRVVAARIVYRFRSPRRGDIVVFKTPPRTAAACRTPLGSTYLKRIIGLPGERITEKRGIVLVDGKPLREPYVRRAERDDRTGAWPRIAAGHYFMMGDNRAASCDSRVWGTVPRSSLIGPIVATYWPLTRLAVD
jgi:signal peptidase I